MCGVLGHPDLLAYVTYINLEKKKENRKVSKKSGNIRLRENKLIKASVKHFWLKADYIKYDFAYPSAEHAQAINIPASCS